MPALRQNQCWQAVGEIGILEEGVPRAGDPARDGIERLDVAPPALRRAGVDEHERWVVEAPPELVHLRDVVVTDARRERSAVDPRLGGDERAYRQAFQRLYT